MKFFAFIKHEEFAFKENIFILLGIRFTVLAKIEQVIYRIFRDASSSRKHLKLLPVIFRFFLVIKFEEIRQPFDKCLRISEPRPVVNAPQDIIKDKLQLMVGDAFLLQCLA